MSNFSKKKILWLAVGSIAIIVILLVSFLSAGSTESHKLTFYSMRLSYDHDNHILHGEERVVYVNNSENMFTSLYFHLYPNAFREGAKASVVSSNNAGEAYPNGYSFGCIEIKNVTYESGEVAPFQICGEDENILEVSLAEELYPDETVVLNISFKTTLANINHRLGYGKNTINFGNFYPIACVYEEGKGFSQSLYHSNGDPFYSDCSNYNVELTYDPSFTLASTGDATDEKVFQGVATRTITAKNVRDFCFVLSERLEKVSKTVDNLEINYYGYKGDDNLDVCLQVCEDAMQTFQDLYGDYPYYQISVVKSNFVHGGMEYPNIVLISDALTNQNDVNYVIVHEIAHQWWYGLVGNDEYNHAWMDEGLAEYSTLLFFKENAGYGEDYNELVNGAIESYKLFEKIYTKVTGRVDGRMDRALCDFETEPEYVQCVYTKGVIMFNSLKELVGERKFLVTLKDYFEYFKYKNATPADLIAQFISSCGKSMEGFFESWINGKVVVK